MSPDPPTNVSRLWRSCPFHGAAPAASATFRRPWNVCQDGMFARTECLLGRNVCQDGMFARTECLPGRNVCQDGMFAGTGRLPGRDVCRDGTFFIPGLHKNVYTQDDFPQGKFAKLAKYRSGKAGRSVSPYCRDPASVLGRDVPASI